MIGLVPGSILTECIPVLVFCTHWLLWSVHPTVSLVLYFLSSSKKISTSNMNELFFSLLLVQSYGENSTYPKKVGYFFDL